MDIERKEWVSFETIIALDTNESDEETSNVSQNSKLSFNNSPIKSEENLRQFIQLDESNNAPSLESISLQDEAEVPALTLQLELLRWHYCLGHLLFRKIKIMAALGLLPRRFMTV
eukprot:8145646-Ditylum_brightwellii.AAC.3